MNNNIKTSIITFIIGLLLGCIVAYFWKKNDKEIINVPFKVEVKVPKIEKDFDTLYFPKPEYSIKKVIDSIYYKQYISLIDSLDKNELFKDAITIREYKQVFEDDSVKIDSYIKTRGTLLSSQVSYLVKQRVILVDTVIPLTVPRKAKLYVGGYIYPSIKNNPLESLGIGPSVMLLNRKQTKSFNIGYDAVNKSISAGLLFGL